MQIVLTKRGGYGLLFIRAKDHKMNTASTTPSATIYQTQTSDLKKHLAMVHADEAWETLREVNALMRGVVKHGNDSDDACHKAHELIAQVFANRE